ncbi:MAG: DEAD/DEAH box helicase [Gallionellales bacterium 35-53-114]|nr:MAG: DEAD/DEAH box helicase [Gallionellales bacterium 35-53-114]OYZ64874.1 MAG: DEAD/DEAH box helicase [Gallionellales bacterium 24-53-125]OZB07588.1 MAG: DEAD/DEAH box helicase [Gallionellales bacterium 39-52-133]
MTSKSQYSAHQSAYFAHQLTLRAASDSMDSMAGALLDAQVDLNPHQIDAALFATSNPLSKGVILADEVGLGKTIEAGLLIAQRWAERKRRILIITPANLRKQWHQELVDKFGITASIIEAKSYKQAIKDGVHNPFESKTALICSYQFAAGKAKEVQAVQWDLVVIDEAHRLRNVYKPENKTANILREALLTAPKVLLTATPLQNSLLELYGLVSFVDERVFGDLDSFKTQFGQLKDAASFDALKSRIQPICKRTLRRQVEAYVKYTRRIPMLQEFIPGEDETRLYNLVSEYLQRDELFALPNSQRQLITLVLRKLLSSSTFAIAGALETLIKRLSLMLDEKSISIDLSEELDKDFESLDELADETGAEGQDNAKAKTQNEILAIKAEILELESFRDLAVSITENSKGMALLQALKVAFKKLEELGAAQKSIIFTESRRTQDYLLKLLANTPEFGADTPGVVLFNGSNSDEGSKHIYAEWLKRHQGTDRITGSRTADTRAALVDYFREQGSIMIATEAGAEGINLQFCSMVINYDLPWNPQRIEQRIGRCHRYGQKHDVVVVNFLNRDNEADKRVYELLAQKFQLFDGVFGASDEVLGAVESGVDFERRIAEIYQTCRHPETIHTAFQQLQLDLAGEISDAMINARKSLLENFDEEVQERLRLRNQDAHASLGKLERLLMRFTRAALNGHAEFDEDDAGFKLNTLPVGVQESAESSIPLGRYELPRRSEEAHIFRLAHPLAQTLIEQAQRQTLQPSKLILDYDAYGSKVSVIEGMRGQSGVLLVQKLRVHSLGSSEEHMLTAAIDSTGNVHDNDITERLLSMPGHAVATPRLHNNPVQETLLNTQAPAEQNMLDFAAANVSVPAQLEAEIGRQKSLILSNLETRNLSLFSQETDKLDSWADDLKVGLEREIKELDRQIKEARTRSKGAANLAEKLAVQKEQRDLEASRDRKRRELFQRQDEIQTRRDNLIDELEEQLSQKVTVQPIFACKWEVS